MIELWFDGCCGPVNPGGHAAAGTYIKQDGKKIFQHSEYVGSGSLMSSNVAEYMALVVGLRFLLARGLSHEAVIVRGDSRLVIEQMTGTWKITAGLYVPYAQEAKRLKEHFTNLRGEWIPRELNTRCDSLSKRPLAQRGVCMTFRHRESASRTTPPHDAVGTQAPRHHPSKEAPRPALTERYRLEAFAHLQSLCLNETKSTLQIPAEATMLQI